MAEVHPTPHHTGNIGSFLQQSTAGLPNWAWILVVVGGIAAAVFIPKLLPGASGGSTTSPSTGTGLGLAVDPTTGLPYATEGLVPSGGITTSPTTPTVTTTPTTTTTQTTTPDIDTNSVQTGNTLPSFETRGQISTGAGAGTYNVPIRDTPGGNVVGTVPFGQRVYVTGSVVQGPNNFGANVPAGTGSTQWYPVQGGYVSGFDLSQITANSPPAWPAQYQRSRHFQMTGGQQNG